MSITQNPQNKQCKIDGCTGRGKLKANGIRHFTKGYCAAHYAKLLRYGTPLPQNRFTPRPAIIKGEIVKIPLGVNAKDGYAVVDKEFAWVADNYRWTVARHGYAVTSPKRGRATYMHHLTIGKPPKGLVTDHINRNKLDNRLSNLRHVTQSVNSLNLPLKSNNKSGHRCISFNTTSGYWVVSIKRNYKRVYYKYCKTIPEAIAARDKFLSTLNEPSVL